MLQKKKNEAWKQKNLSADKYVIFVNNQERYMQIVLIHPITIIRISSFLDLEFSVTTNFEILASGIEGGLAERILCLPSFPQFLLSKFESSCM